MSLKYTLLGFLNYGPMTGYDLKGYLDASTQGVWYASLSQIYPTLQKLEQEGWVESQEIPQEGKPDRKYYLITAEGRAGFQDWLDEGVHELARHKNLNMLKLFFAGSLPKKRVLHHLQVELDLQRKQLAKDEQSTKQYIEGVVAATGLKREAVMWEAIRRLGIESKKTTIRWLEETMKTVEESYDD